MWKILAVFEIAILCNIKLHVTRRLWVKSWRKNIHCLTLNNFVKTATPAWSIGSIVHLCFFYVVRTHQKQRAVAVLTVCGTNTVMVCVFGSSLPNSITVKKKRELQISDGSVEVFSYQTEQPQEHETDLCLRKQVVTKLHTCESFKEGNGPGGETFEC